MPRPDAYHTEADRPRRHGRRDEEADDFDEGGESGSEQERPPRRKPSRKSNPRRGREEEEDDDDEDEDEDDHPHRKQLILHGKPRKGKSHGKELARKKRHDSSASDDDSNDESSEEEVKPSKKKKGKSHKKETLTIQKWEPVHRDQVDPEFVDLIVKELGQHPGKIAEGIEKGLLTVHAQTGEYNIEGFFKKGIFSAKDESKWDKAVEKQRRNPHLEKILHCQAKRGDPMGRRGDIYGGPSTIPVDRARAMIEYIEPARRRHHRFTRHCPECLLAGDACGYYDFDY
ncbi:MAG: hypothetical protein Q9166_003115 [cf. Caloplaca sp. 2 TL-2023]